MNDTPKRSSADLVTGGTFVVIGAAFVFGAVGYGLGTPTRLGAGAFPAIVGSLVAAFGIALIVRGMLSGQAGSLGRLPWLAMGLIGLSIVVFAALVSTVGLAPATFAATFIAGTARLERPLTAGQFGKVALIAAALTVACIGLFVFALSLRIPIINF